MKEQSKLVHSSMQSPSLTNIASSSKDILLNNLTYLPVEISNSLSRNKGKLLVDLDYWNLGMLAGGP